MDTTIRSLIVCLISFNATSCIHRAESLRMLEVRADYEGKENEEASELKLSDDQALHDSSNAVPVRTTPKTANIWIFPHETPSKEYFWGGWISVVIEGDRWEVERSGGASHQTPMTIPTQKPKGKNKREGS